MAGLSLLNTVFELFFGELDAAFKSVPLPEGVTESIVLIAQIVILVIAVLVLLPQLYIGIKGLKMAKKPDSSKGHIIWGIILLVITAIGLIAPLRALIQGDGRAFANVSEFLSIAVDVMILFEYVRLARAVRKGK